MVRAAKEELELTEAGSERKHQSNHKTMYSLPRVVREWEWTDCKQSSPALGAQSAVVAKHNQVSWMSSEYSNQMSSGIQMSLNSNMQMSRNNNEDSDMRINSISEWVEITIYQCPF